MAPSDAPGAGPIGAPSETALRISSDLLRSSHELGPADLAAAVADRGRALGATEAVVLIVDLSQRTLCPLGDGSVRDAGSGEELDVDTTIAGRAFRTEQAITVEADDGTATVMVPLLDGADRLGVLRLAFPPGSDVDEPGCWLFASLVAELVTTKSALGDAIAVARRSKPLSLAAELRWTFLPPLTFRNARVEIASILEPAYEIAGDSFDYAVNDRTAHVAIIDAMGHGLEASRIANLAVGAYRHSRRHLLNLADTLRSMDAVVAEEFGPERFVTGQLAELDLSSGSLHILSAGHPRPLLLRDGRLVGEIECMAQLPIGLGDVDVATSEVTLQPGDRVLFYTDGVVEARSSAGEEFGLERLGDLAARAEASGEPIAEVARRLIHSVLAHEAGVLRDDATVVLVGWRGEHDRDG